MRNLKIITLGSLLFLASCSSSSIILNKEYLTNQTRPQSLAIVFQENQARVAYEGNVEPEFGKGNQDSLIIAFFKTQIPKDILSQTIFTNVHFSGCTVDGYYDNQIVDTKDGYVEMPVLSRGARVACGDEPPGFVLFLKEVYIGTRLDIQYSAPVMVNGMMIGGGVSSTKKLRCRAQVVLWDNIQKQAVLYGYASASASGIFSVITMNEWLSVYRGFVSDIFSKSPVCKR